LLQHQAPDELSRQLVTVAVFHARGTPRANRTRVIELSETLLTVHREPRGNALIVRLEGQVDILSAPGMRAEFDTALAEAGETMVVDLTGLTFLGSVGIAELMRVHQQTDANQTHLIVVAPPFIRRLLDITGVSDSLDLRSSLDDVRA
jgi:anti-sigma B factor antagonist